jgi:putative colanic acid polymerase
MMMTRLLPILIFITIVFQHFRLFYIGGYEATLGLFTGLLVVVLLIKRINFSILMSVWAFLIITSSSSALFSRETVAADYMQTFALFILAAFIITSAFGEINWLFVQSKAFAISILTALLVIVAISVGQVALGSMGSDLLFNPFGAQQYLHPYKPNIGLVQFPRAHGFFLEPSYNAFVIGTLTTTLLCLNRFTKSAVLLVVPGLAACQSATGLVLLVLLLGFVALRSRPAITLGAGAMIVAVVVYAGDYLWIRILSFGLEGSSAYYRVFAPIEVLLDVLGSHPLGMPFGSVEEVMGRYDLEMAGVQARSLDNGFYVIVFYFGWIGIILLLLLLAVAIIASRNRGVRSYGWIAPLWLFASLFFSGGIMAPEFGIMTFIVVAAFRSSRVNDKYESESSRAAKHNNSNLSRLGRSASHDRVRRQPT